MWAGICRSGASGLDIQALDFRAMTDQTSAQKRSRRPCLPGFFRFAVVVPFLLVLFTSTAAQAQLRGLGNGGSLPGGLGSAGSLPGGVGVPLGDLGNPAGNIGNAVPGADSSANSTLIGTGISIPLGGNTNALTRPTDTITNTIDGAGRS